MISINSLFGFLLFISPVSDTSIYDIEVRSAVDDRAVRLSEFKGYTLLITTVPVNRESKEKILHLSQLATSDKNLKIIAVPVQDDVSRKAEGESVLLNQVKATDMLVTKPVNALRSSGYEQHALLKWLTNSKLNGHFEAEWNNTGEYFLVSDNGQLYAVLQADVPKKVLEEAIQSGGKQ